MSHLGFDFLGLLLAICNEFLQKLSPTRQIVVIRKRYNSRVTTSDAQKERDTRFSAKRPVRLCYNYPSGVALGQVSTQILKYGGVSGNGCGSK